MNPLGVVLVLLTLGLAAVGFTFLGLYLSKKLGPSKPLTEEERLVQSQVPPLVRPSHRPIIPEPKPKTPKPKIVITTPKAEDTTPSVPPSELPTELPSEDEKAFYQSLRTRESLSSTTEFDLVANAPFVLGDKKLILNVKPEFSGKFNSYTYSLNGDTFSPEKFVINDQEQTGLPTDKELTSLKVYLSHEILRTPLMVILTFDGETVYYSNNFNSSWILAPQDLLEERLDFLDSVSNNEITVNLARRSDYYRNGTGSSDFESDKDVNVYVEPDSPCSGWSTYTHKVFCSFRKRFLPFYPVRFTFGTREIPLDIPGKCEHVEVFFEPERTTLLPPVVAFKHKTVEKFYVLVDNKYVLSDGEDKITRDNLVAKLKQISSSHP